MPELMGALHNLKNEVYEYHNGKRQPEKQQDLFEDGEGEFTDQLINGKSKSKAKAKMVLAED